MALSAVNPSTQDQGPQRDYIIAPVRTSTSDDTESITELFREYAQSLNLDLSFQSFAAELSSIPGRYAPSQHGELLLARHIQTNQALGCVALRRLNTPSENQHTGFRIGEIKRLYTIPASRGMGLGSALANQIVQVARDLEYDEIRLDTLPSMSGAQRIYEKLGFVDIKPYCFNPVEGARFLGLKLCKDS